MKKKMKGVIFHGIGNISLEEMDVPTIQNASDAIVRITLTTICGSDLHLIHGQTVVDPESPIGHECVGVIEETVWLWQRFLTAVTAFIVKKDLHPNAKKAVFSVSVPSGEG
jgi:D-arabinose 1-dehydrogenase-like Zn-dependent alcohol dehydrogenase